METESKEFSQLPIVFYDGECGLCDKAVQWTMRHDREGVLKYAPLQGSTAESFLGKLDGPPESWTIIYKDEEGTYERSTAALKIALRIKAFGWLPRLGLFVPLVIRDSVYRLIALVRYRVFGKIQACALVNPEVRLRFLP